MIPDITDPMIDDMIQSSKMAEAGHRYWQQGRVTELLIDPEMQEISALVQGGERHPYVVSIFFDDEKDKFGYDTDCSCPIGIGCKHCAAVLYATRSQQVPIKTPTSNKITFPKPPQPAKSAPLPQALSFWLAETQGPATRVRAHEIVYAVTLRPLHPVKLPKGKSEPVSPSPTPYEMSVQIWIRNPSADSKSTWRKPDRYNTSWTYALPTAIDTWLVK
jgi:hypothetical protein